MCGPNVVHVRTISIDWGSSSARVQWIWKSIDARVRFICGSCAFQLRFKHGIFWEPVGLKQFRVMRGGTTIIKITNKYDVPRGILWPLPFLFELAIPSCSWEVAVL